jgi:hypothetical protein
MRRLVEVERYEAIRSLNLHAGIKAQVDGYSDFVEELLMLGLTGLGQGFRKACIETVSASDGTEA